MSKAKRKAPRPQGDAGPTPERWARGDVALVPQTIADEAGRPARPYRAADTLDTMLRRGSISAAMRQAGADFQALFALAQLDPLRAPDLMRVPQGARELPVTLRQAEARKRVWRALQALGGAASPAGSCVWHVLGCGWTVKDWALRQGWGGRPLHRDAAAGVLVGALGMLQAHFGL